MSHRSSRRTGSFSSAVDDLLDTSISAPQDDESKVKESTKFRPDRDRRRTPSRSRSRGRRSTRSPSQRRTPTPSSSQSRSRSGTSSSSRSRSRKGTSSSSRSRSRSSTSSSSRSPSRRSTRSPSHKRTPTPTSSRNGSKKMRRRPRNNKTKSPNHTMVLQSEQQFLEQNGIDLKSLSLKAAEELSNRPKNGVIYDEVTANLKSIKIKKRLKHLSKNHRKVSIDEAIEIADAACLLRLLRKPKHEIEVAGQMAHSGALLMIQADMLAEKGRELLAQSKRKLKSVEL